MKLYSTDHEQQHDNEAIQMGSMGKGHSIVDKEAVVVLKGWAAAGTGVEVDICAGGSYDKLERQDGVIEN